VQGGGNGGRRRAVAPGARAARSPSPQLLEAAELRLGRAVTPGEANRRREGRGARRPEDRSRTTVIATLSRPGRPGGRPLRGTPVALVGPLRGRPTRSLRRNSSKRPSSVSAGRSRPAKRTADAKTRSEETRGPVTHHRDRDALAPRPTGRSAASRTPVALVGRFEDARRAPFAATPRSGRAPSRPGGHARRSEPQTRRRGARRPEDRSRTTVIATLSRPGRPGGRPLRGRPSRSPSPRFLEAAELRLGRAVTPGEANRRREDEERGDPRTGHATLRDSDALAPRPTGRSAASRNTRRARRPLRGRPSRSNPRTGHAPPRSRRSRAPADREVGRFEEHPSRFPSPQFLEAAELRLGRAVTPGEANRRREDEERGDPRTGHAPP
jgi:hypothetical protein